MVSYQEQSSPRYLFSQADFLRVMLVYGLISFIQMAFDTVVPVAMASPRRLGGLELNSEGISMIVGVSSPFQVVLGINHMRR